ncbi:MAG: arsenic resistance protein [Firmicutes bacterium]|nr:arsenic resistance protein [Bacillota bacterium]
MVANLLKGVKKGLPFLLLVFIVLGLIFGYYTNPSFLKNYVTIVLFIMIYPMMINLKVTDVFKSFKNKKAIALSLGINFIIVPITAFLLGKIFFSDEPMLLTGIILIGLIPTSGMTASWTGLAKGNLKLSLVMISINLLISILIIPLYMKLFLGKLITINTFIIFKSLFKVVIIPLILGDLTRRLLIRKYGIKGYKDIKPNFSGISSLGVLAIVFIAMALKSKTIINQLNLVLLSIIPLIILYIIIIFISHFLGNKYLSNKDKVALVYSTTMRNLTIALGISLASFGESLAVFLIAIGYIVQLPIAAYYMKRFSVKQS